MGLRDEILNELLPEMDGDLSEAVESYLFIKKTGGGWDDQNDKPIPSVESTVTGRCFFLSFTLYEMQTYNILNGDVKCIIPSNYERPLQGTRLTIGSQVYEIINEILSPANVVYTLQLRKVGA